MNADIARRIRDEQWDFMRRVNEHGTLWWCVWNKRNLQQAADEQRDCLIGGMERSYWIAAHPEWWSLGDWDDARYACAVALTAAGRLALEHRHLYDLYPVDGGLVEPGWRVVPATPSAERRLR